MGPSPPAMNAAAAAVAQQQQAALQALQAQQLLHPEGNFPVRSYEIRTSHSISLPLVLLNRIFFFTQPLISAPQVNIVNVDTPQGPMPIPMPIPAGAFPPPGGPPHPLLGHPGGGPPGGPAGGPPGGPPGPPPPHQQQGGPPNQGPPPPGMPPGPPGPPPPHFSIASPPIMSTSESQNLHEVRELMGKMR